MSGHSKWANIKNRKAAQDQKRGRIFSKLSRLITAAVKEGGSDDPSANPRLRLAIDRAKAENMPRDNIQRAIENASRAKEAAEEFVLEGYGPEGVAILIEVLTDNRQRTIQEIKNLFQKNGGSLAEPGAVSFQFEKKGLVEIDRPNNEEETLKLIDLGAEDISEEEASLTILVRPSSLEGFREKISQSGFSIRKTDLILEPKIKVKIDDPRKAKALIGFLNLLEEHDDVQRVFANLDIPDETLRKVTDG